MITRVQYICVNIKLIMRTKHIDVKLYFIRDLVDKEEVEVKKINTSVNLVDYFTKASPTLKFELYNSLIGLV